MNNRNSTRLIFILAMSCSVLWAADGAAEGGGSSSGIASKLVEPKREELLMPEAWFSQPKYVVPYYVRAHWVLKRAIEQKQDSEKIANAFLSARGTERSLSFFQVYLDYCDRMLNVAKLQRFAALDMKMLGEHANDSGDEAVLTTLGLVYKGFFACPDEAGKYRPFTLVNPEVLKEPQTLQVLRLLIPMISEQLAALQKALALLKRLVSELGAARDRGETISEAQWSSLLACMEEHKESFVLLSPLLEPKKDFGGTTGTRSDQTLVATYEELFFSSHAQVVIAARWLQEDLSRGGLKH